MDLRLIKPIVALERSYHNMIQDWYDSGENLVPFILKYDYNDFTKFIEQINGFEIGIGIPDTFVSHSTFWMVNTDDKILGVINIRHFLTDKLKAEGGHIGYGIRPTERKKGYATQILRLGLLEAKRMGIDRVLLTCNEDNTGSIKTIIKNKGQFFDEGIVDGNRIKRYWIENK